MARPDGSRFLLGVEFADGRRASGLPGSDGGDVVLHPGGGSGGAATVEQSWWLSPLPPEGPVRVVVRCPGLGTAETVVDLDGTAIRRAAERVVELRPREPEPPAASRRPAGPPRRRLVRPPLSSRGSRAGSDGSAGAGQQRADGGR